MKKLAAIGASVRASIGASGGVLVGASGAGAAGLVIAALLATTGQAADHQDSPTLAATPMADITDVYAWMAGAKLNLVMGVSPRDDGSRSFGPDVLYVFHLTSKPGQLGLGMAGTETRVICKFGSNTSVECWVTDPEGTIKDFVTGDPSGTAGVASRAGKLKVFAGRRSDPAFFNATGFASAMTTLATLRDRTPDVAGCPTGIAAGEAEALRVQLRTGADAFATANVMALVVEVDSSLVNTGTNKIVSVWGSTHAGS